MRPTTAVGLGCVKTWRRRVSPEAARVPGHVRTDRSRHRYTLAPSELSAGDEPAPLEIGEPLGGRALVAAPPLGEPVLRGQGLAAGNQAQDVGLGGGLACNPSVAPLPLQ